MKRIFLLVLCVLLLAVPSYAASYNVGTDYSTLEEAFGEADDNEDTDPVFNFTESYTPDSAITVDGTAFTEEVDGSESNFDLSNFSTSFSSITFSGKYNSASGARHFVLTNPSLITFSSITLTGTGNIGGGVQINSGAVKFSNSTFTSNGSSGNGGGLYIAGGTVELEGNTFTKNTANNGGAIYIESGTLTLSAAPTFDGNVANSNGGAIYIASGVTVEFPTAQAFSNNIAANNERAMKWQLNFRNFAECRYYF